LRRHRELFKVIKRGSEEQLHLVVRPFGAVHDDLSWNDRVLRVKKKLLFGGQVPGLAKPFIAVTCTELPEGGIPRRAVAGICARAGGHDPAFDTTVVSGTNVQGDSVLWGSSSVSGSSVLWGSSVVWGSSVLWGSSMDESQALLTQGEN
jgi:hypothetical protein